MIGLASVYCFPSNNLGICIITKLEELREFEVTREVHELLTLGEHYENKDDSVAYEGERVDVQPELRCLLIRDLCQIPRVEGYSWQIKQESLEHCETANQPKVPQAARESRHELLLA